MTFNQEARPAVLLRPGDSRSARVQLHKGTVLRFSLGLSRSPENGFLRFRVLLDGRVAYESKFLKAAVRDRWRSVSVTLDGEGPSTLEFLGEHVTGDGDVITTDPPDQSSWIVLASPRLSAPSGRPRILVWISQDTLRADHVGAYGYSRSATPAFDSASRGWTFFDQAVSPASWTLPALTSQFTGRYPSFHGAVLATRVRDKTLPTIFEVFSRGGFTVLGVTGNRFISPEFFLAGGFDALAVVDDRPAEEVNHLALRALGEWDGGDLALFVHYMDPHAPYSPPPPYDRLFDPDYRGPSDGNNFDGLPIKGLRTQDIDHVRALYDGEVAYADHQVGVLLGELQRRGLLDDAVIVYTADHGEEFLDHGSWLHSRTVYEEMLRVPLALRVPGVKPHHEPTVVSLVDLAPTLLDAFGIPGPRTFQGRSLMPLLRGQRLPDVSVFAETERNQDHNERLAVRRGHEKYILVTSPGNETPPPILREECFDLLRDPGEKSPGPVPDDLRRQALAYLTQARQEARGGQGVELSPELEERFRALGYIQ